MSEVVRCAVGKVHFFSRFNIMLVNVRNGRVKVHLLKDIFCLLWNCYRHEWTFNILNKIDVSLCLLRNTLSSNYLNLCL